MSPLPSALERTRAQEEAPGGFDRFQIPGSHAGHYFQKYEMNLIPDLDFLHWNTSTGLNYNFKHI